MCHRCTLGSRIYERSSTQKLRRSGPGPLLPKIKRFPASQGFRSWGTPWSAVSIEPCRSFKCDGVSFAPSRKLLRRLVTERSLQGLETPSARRLPRLYPIRLSPSVTRAPSSTCGWNCSPLDRPFNSEFGRHRVPLRNSIRHAAIYSYLLVGYNQIVIDRRVMAYQMHAFLVI